MRFFGRAENPSKKIGGVSIQNRRGRMHIEKTQKGREIDISLTEK